MEAGEAEIESTGDAVEFDTRFGEAHLEAGGRVRVSTQSDEVRFEVLVGRTILEGDGGAPLALGAGEKIAIAIGGAIIEHTGAPEKPSEPARDAAPPPEVAARDAADETGAIAASIEGNGVTVQAGKVWNPLPSGDARLPPGSHVRVPKGAAIAVRRGAEQASVQGAADVVVGTGEGALLSAVDGQVTLDASGTSVRVDVPGGSIVARGSGAGGSRASISVRKGTGAEVAAERGEVEVRGKNDRVVLSTGQSTTLGQRGDLPTAEAVAPARADFSIVAGESPVVHDPGGPTAIRIMFDGVCPGSGEVELSGAAARGRRARSKGAGSAVVALGPGVSRYRVRCVDESGGTGNAKTGVIRVAKDSGAARLPRAAPHNLIDADGRRYTVLYQNLLPELTVGWPRAPSASGFTLHVEPERGAPRAVSAAAASVKFSSGQLGEGTYRFWFDVAGDPQQRSPQTTLKIDFDNAAPAAQIQEPAVGSPIEGSVTVSGIATEGNSVSVSGSEIPLDGQFRFRGEASPRPGEGALAIRIAHPKHGVHYYLRRGAP
jgi:hypothetical protein